MLTQRLKVDNARVFLAENGAEALRFLLARTTGPLREVVCGREKETERKEICAVFGF